MTAERSVSWPASPCVPPPDNDCQWQTVSLRDDWKIPEPPDLEATVCTTGRRNQELLKRFYWSLTELPTADGVLPVRRIHKRLLCELAYQTRVYSERDVTFAKQAELARKLKCSLRTINRRMHDLAEMGLLLNEQQFYHQGNLTWLLWHPQMAEAGLTRRVPQRDEAIPVEVGQDRTSYDKARQDTPKNGVKCLDSKDLQDPITIELLKKETDAARPHPVENLISNELLQAINAELKTAHLQPFAHRGDEVLRWIVRQAGSRVDLLPRWIAFETQRPRTTPVMVNRYLSDPDVLKRMDRWLDEPTDPPKPRQKRTSYPGPLAPQSQTQPPFTVDEVHSFLTGALDQAPEHIREELTDILNDLPSQYANLEVLEQRLTAMEDKMIATARAQQSEADLAEARAALDSQLRLYRGKMSTPQLVMLEKQFLDRWLLERLNFPRLSLFCLH